MRQYPARYSAPVSFVHAPSLADFITTTPVFKFSVHTPGSPPRRRAAAPRRKVVNTRIRPQAMLICNETIAAHAHWQFACRAKNLTGMRSRWTAPVDSPGLSSGARLPPRVRSPWHSPDASRRGRPARRRRPSGSAKRSLPMPWLVLLAAVRMEDADDTGQGRILCGAPKGST
jgi:hypothetical protein